MIWGSNNALVTSFTACKTRCLHTKVVARWCLQCTRMLAFVCRFAQRVTENRDFFDDCSMDATSLFPQRPPSWAARPATAQHSSKLLPGERPGPAAEARVTPDEQLAAAAAAAAAAASASAANNGADSEPAVEANGAATPAPSGVAIHRRHSSSGMPPIPAAQQARSLAVLLGPGSAAPPAAARATSKRDSTPPQQKRAAVVRYQPALDKARGSTGGGQGVLPPKARGGTSPGGSSIAPAAAAAARSRSAGAPQPASSALALPMIQSAADIRPESISPGGSATAECDVTTASDRSYPDSITSMASSRMMDQGAPVRGASLVQLAERDMKRYADTDLISPETMSTLRRQTSPSHVRHGNQHHVFFFSGISKFDL